ncbi:hypothetical protein [Lysinibacillus fusiformis]|uniref:hypothetical protein n=1 Tax=Lysinibacillus fusiformis TaxID=28031 RepID=UPI003AAB41BD
MKIKAKQENCNGIPYDFFDQNSNSICFMLSGTGYSYEKPVLYYSRLLLLELGYDVIQINYSFEQQLFEQEPQAISNMVYSIVNPIVEHCLRTKPYTNAVYIGKSLGTLPIIDFYMQQSSSISTRYILLTPLLSLDHTMANLLNKQAFLAIGTADPHFSQEKIAQLTTLDLAVFDDLNHSLEDASNIIQSIQFCESLFIQLKAYIQKNEPSISM